MHIRQQIPATDLRRGYSFRLASADSGIYFTRRVSAKVVNDTTTIVGALTYDERGSSTIETFNGNDLLIVGFTNRRAKHRRRNMRRAERKKAAESVNN
jgi:hypothetical protein